MRIVKLQTDANRKAREPFRCGLVAVAVALLVATGGCGGGSSSPSGPSGPPATTPAGPANVAGNYTFTYTASAACAAQLPASFRARSYQAVITQSGSTIAVNLVGNFPALVFNGSVSGSSVSFTWAFTETVSGGFLVGPAFTGTGTVSGSSIQGTMSGTLQYSPLSGSTSSCVAADHQFTFAPR